MAIATTSWSRALQTNEAVQSGDEATLHTVLGIDAWEGRIAQLESDFQNLPTSETFYDVRDYGAVLDGTSDEQRAIQAAADAASAAGGGTVFLPSATYKIGQNADNDEIIYAPDTSANRYRFPAEDAHGLRVPSNVNFLAEQGAKFEVHPDTDRTGVTRNPAEPSGSFTLVYSETPFSSYSGNNSTSTAYVIRQPYTDPAHLVVEQLTAGTWSTLTLGADYILAGQSLTTVVAVPTVDTLRITNTTLAQNFAFEGLEIDGDISSAPNVTGGENLNFKNATNIKVSRCVMRNSTDDGLDLDGCNYVIVDRCEFYRSAASGIHCAGAGVRKIIISNCHFEDCTWDRVWNINNGFSSAAIDFVQGEDQVVTGCTFVNNARALTCMNNDAVIAGCSFRQGYAVVPDFSPKKVGEQFDWPQVLLKGGLTGNPFQYLASTALFSGCDFRSIAPGPDGTNLASCVRAEDYYAETGKGFGTAIFAGCNFQQSGTNTAALDFRFIDSVRVINCNVYSQTYAYNEYATATNVNPYPLLIDHPTVVRGDSVQGVSPEGEVTAPVNGDLVRVLLTNGIQEFWERNTDVTGDWVLVLTVDADYTTGRTGSLLVNGCEINRGEIRVQNADARISNNTFAYASGDAIDMRLGADDCHVLNNLAPNGVRFLNITNGSFRLRCENNVAPDSEVYGYARDSKFSRNVFGSLNLISNLADGNVFRDNEFTSGITTNGTNDLINKWAGNHGDGVPASHRTKDISAALGTTSAGTVTITSSIARAGMHVSLTRATAAGTLGHLSVQNIVDETSFDIVSSSATETSTVAWEIDTTDG